MRQGGGHGRSLSYMAEETGQGDEVGGAGHLLTWVWDPPPPVDRQTPVKTLPSLVLSTWSVINRNREDS